VKGRLAERAGDASRRGPSSTEIQLADGQFAVACGADELAVTVTIRSQRPASMAALRADGCEARGV
jgi:hypothetical protein